MEKIPAMHPSLSPSCSDTDSLNAPSAADSPPISVANNPSFSSPARTYAEPQNDEGCIQGVHIHGADASSEGRRFSVSSNSEDEMVRQHACDILPNVDAIPGQQGWEASPIRNGEALNEGYNGDEGKSRCRGDNANPSHPSVDSSGSDADLEKGWGSGNVKQVGGEEEGQGECCRVCYLTVDRGPSSSEFIKLGCACKEGLAIAHRRCAETWFKIKGNRTCEICGSTARNISGSGDASFIEQWNDGETSHVGLSRAERCWQNQPLCNTVLVCVILVLIASWLFRVTLF
eukprot:c22193_g1_i1 orf=3-866(-)